MTKKTLAELLENFGDKNIDNKKATDYGDVYLAKLRLSCESFLHKDNFEVGQTVKWKENLQNRKFPYKDQPAIVIDVLKEPVVSKDAESGSPYFLENLDIILGLTDDDGTFLTFYYDSRRFEPYSKPSGVSKVAKKPV